MGWEALAPNCWDGAGINTSVRALTWVEIPPTQLVTDRQREWISKAADQPRPGLTPRTRARLWGGRTKRSLVMDSVSQPSQSSKVQPAL
jgi:hypothetical protein